MTPDKATDEVTRCCCCCGRVPLGDAVDPKGRSELRPYGKGGAPICFDCAFKPENKAETDRQLDAAYDAAEEASPVGGIALTDDGVRALDPATIKDGEILIIDRGPPKAKA